ncbi:GtrA family protein [Hwanghaeella grinnelliae]|uniref:GtrA family protein n=1 Tax=Hwanghaeella grinnelliae TaxID=2500179 RepID=A0A437QHU6_9PROT|nr:GtrA family protein [Hwanghaeella grinnelliae]
MIDSIRKAKHLVPMFRFACVGALNTVLDFGVFYVFYNYVLPNALVSNTIAFCTAVLVSYNLNKRWTFATSKRIDGDFSYFVKFFLVCACGLMLSTLLIYSLSPFVHVMIAKALSIIVVFVWNYTFASKVFKFDPSRVGE